jgi:hypothetical protein
MIPLAAGVLQPWGILLNPAVGAVLMSLNGDRGKQRAAAARSGRGLNWP